MLVNDTKAAKFKVYEILDHAAGIDEATLAVRSDDDLLLFVLNKGLQWIKALRVAEKAQRQDAELAKLPPYILKQFRVHTVERAAMASALQPDRD